MTRGTSMSRRRFMCAGAQPKHEHACFMAMTALLLLGYRRVTRRKGGFAAARGICS